jgi:hypothetical protein
MALGSLNTRDDGPCGRDVGRPGAHPKVVETLLRNEKLSWPHDRPFPKPARQLEDTLRAIEETELPDSLPIETLAFLLTVQERLVKLLFAVLLVDLRRDRGGGALTEFERQELVEPVVRLRRAVGRAVTLRARDVRAMNGPRRIHGARNVRSRKRRGGRRSRARSPDRPDGELPHDRVAPRASYHRRVGR